MTARHSLDQIGLDGVTAGEAKLKADVARVIDGEAWKAMDDGRDALEGSLWHLRRDWALEKASQIIDLVTESRVRDLEERLAKAAEALEPFAKVEPMDVYEDEDEDARGSYLLTQSDFRRARTAIAKAEGRS